MRSMNQASEQGYHSDVQSIVTFLKSSFSLSFKLKLKLVGKIRINRLSDYCTLPQ